MIPITRPWLPPLDAYASLLEEVWSSRMLSNFGDMATRLEARAREYLGAAEVLTVSSGDVALALALRSFELPPGGRVLVPSFTFNSTVNAILWNGLTPDFVDIDPETLTIDPADVATRLEGAVAIVATHVFGAPAAIEELTALARSAGARLLFDAAHGYGSLHDGRHIGTFGDAEVFSLSGTKPVTSGEGGLFSTADPVLAERFRYLRAYGFQADYHARYIGLNGKMSELHAALGLLTVPRIEEALAARMRHVTAYVGRLDGLGLAYQRVAAGDRSTYKDFAILFRDTADRVRTEGALTAAGVQTKRYFRPCHQMDAYRAHARRPLPATESTYERILCLPLYEGLTDAERETVSSTIVRTLERARPRAATTSRRRAPERAVAGAVPGVRA